MKKFNGSSLFGEASSVDTNKLLSALQLAAPSLITTEVTEGVASSVASETSLDKLLQAMKEQLKKMESAATPAAIVKEPTPVVGGAALLKDDPIYGVYFSMLAKGIPPPAVSHKMKKEGHDPAILECNPNEPLPDKFKPKLEAPGKSFI